MSNPASSQQENQFLANSIVNYTKNNDYLEKLPPLIEREVFFGNPQIANAKLSPDGKFLAFQKPFQGVLNVWVKRLEEPFEQAHPVTADPNRPIPFYFWSRDGRYILYGQDQGGNENFHIYAVDPTANVAIKDSAPRARDLTPFNDIQARIYARPKATPNHIIVGLNDRNPKLHDVYRLNLSTGEREILLENEQNVANWSTDLEGNIRLGIRQTDDGGTEILRVQGKDLESVYTCNFEESCSPLRFHKDGKRVYMITNKGDNVDTTRLVLFNPASKDSELVDVDPQQSVDFGGAIFSQATDDLIATYYIGDRLRIYAQNEETARDLALLKEELPEGDFYFDSATNDDQLVLVKVSRDIDPGSTYLFNRKTRQLEKLYESRPELPSQHLAAMNPLRYQSRDGLEIPAYLTIPKGVEPKHLPVVIFPHGGPWARDEWGYDPIVQFLANRGYAVFQPNFRGSTGYGKAFLNAGNQEWGTGAMQHDISDGVKYLIAQGIADPDKIAIFGASYGGYATLAGLAFTPELYTTGISYVGPSNILTLLRAIPPYWGPIKKIFKVRVGDLEDPEDRIRLRRQSPLFAAQQIKAPLLVIQGANDPRVKQVESDQIVVALRDLGRQVKYLVAPDEGHGFRQETNRLAVTAAIEEFLARQLGGRQQESISPEIKARLEALTVDVDSVSTP
ncbi:MAG: prolyl oligopeptidase family serine peptidase [Symploca sp. SIO3C6]|nr:prolyl oligopeptidase family serine peptidase [Symploca sp. SIO3C6]